MKKVRCWLQVAVVSALVIMSACEDDPASGGMTCGIATYTLTPTSGSESQITEAYAFHCKDSGSQPDIEYTYEDCPDESGDSFFYYAGGTNQLFVGNYQGIIFTGSTLRAFGNGSTTPFATGTYMDGSVFGTFVFHEGNVEVPNDTECP